MQDLEKLGGKAGVVTQTVKEVVQSLVDDRMIEVDKIGSGNFFWAFPSTAFMGLKNRVEGLEAAVVGEREQIATLEAKLKAATAGREDSDDRTRKLEELSALTVQKEELEKQLKLHAESDPEALKEMEAKVRIQSHVCTWLLYSGAAVVGSLTSHFFLCVRVCTSVTAAHTPIVQVKVCKVAADRYVWLHLIRTRELD